MSKDTTISVYRGGALVAGMNSISVQIDDINLDIQSVDGGAAEFDAFMIYCEWNNPDIRRGDVLQDNGSTSDNYDVINKPEQFLDGHTEIKAILKWGN